MTNYYAQKYIEWHKPKEYLNFYRFPEQKCINFLLAILLFQIDQKNKERKIVSYNKKGYVPII